jgi:hypothetical protein
LRRKNKTLQFALQMLHPKGCNDWSYVLIKLNLPITHLWNSEN